MGFRIIELSVLLVLILVVFVVVANIVHYFWESGAEGNLFFLSKKWKIKNGEKGEQ